MYTHFLCLIHHFGCTFNIPKQPCPVRPQCPVDTGWIGNRTHIKWESRPTNFWPLRLYVSKVYIYIHIYIYIYMICRPYSYIHFFCQHLKYIRYLQIYRYRYMYNVYVCISHYRHRFTPWPFVFCQMLPGSGANPDTSERGGVVWVGIVLRWQVFWEDWNPNRWYTEIL